MSSDERCALFHILASTTSKTVQGRTTLPDTGMADAPTDGDVDESLKCSICLDIFKSPKVLSCGHSFCLEPCLLHVTKAAGRRRRIQCPLCRKSTTLPKSKKAKDLPTNFNLQYILESRDKGEDSIQSQSEKGSRKRNLEDPEPQPCAHLLNDENYCWNCEQFLCVKCTERFHGDSEKHYVTATDTAIKRAHTQSETMVNDTIANLKRRLDRIDELLKSAEISAIRYDIQQSCLQDELRMAMESARGAINEREERYQQQINTRCSTDKMAMNKFIRKSHETRAADQRTLAQLRATLDKVKVGDLSPMKEVISITSVDASCSALTEEIGKLPKAPPFVLVKGSTEQIPRLELPDGSSAVQQPIDNK